MDSSLFGAVRPAPASCDERGKRLKEETDLDLESEQKAEEESESESETKASEEEVEGAGKIVISSRYHNDPYPYYFSGPDYVQHCPSLKIEEEEEEEAEKALAEYWEKAEGASPFDPIPVPANVWGNNFPAPIVLTKERVIRFKALSKRALEYYKANNQGKEKYKYVKLVKVVTQLVPLGTFYITFKAKQTNGGSSKRKVKLKTFQAHVCALNHEQPVVSCSIKIKT